MTHPVDLASLPVPAQRALAPDAPGPLRLMAAKGVLPGVRPAEVVLVLALLGERTDEAGETARATLEALPAAMLNGALSGELHPLAAHHLAEAHGRQPEVLERLLRQPAIGRATLELLAERADERGGEIIATNETLLLAHPTVIERLYMNKRVRMSTADRLIELAVRNNVELALPAFHEAAAAIKDELIQEASEEETFDDVLFRETEALAARANLEGDDEDTHVLDEEGAEQVKEKFLPLHAQIAQMTISQKIRRAILGNSAERMLLIRDSNKLVSAAAAKSPQMRENDAVLVSASRSVSEEVLRIIAMNKEFTRSYRVKLNLVLNPRTPFTFASRLVAHLRDGDLRNLAKNKNVPSAIGAAVRQQLSRKE